VTGKAKFPHGGDVRDSFFEGFGLSCFFRGLAGFFFFSPGKQEIRAPLPDIPMPPSRDRRKDKPVDNQLFPEAAGRINQRLDWRRGWAKAEKGAFMYLPPDGGGGDWLAGE
jgi:hypothetical protein